jgi:hypothetical protein
LLTTDAAGDVEIVDETLHAGSTPGAGRIRTATIC